MRRQIAAVFGSAVLGSAILGSAVFASAVLGFVASSSLAIAQSQSSKDCLAQWQANKGAKQANSAAQKAYLAQCRAGSPVYFSIRDLMESIIDPSADAVWGAVQTVVDQAGVHETFPKTDEDWLNVRRAAVRIIEGGNLLMMPNRDAAPAGAKSEAPGVELEPAQITALIRKNRSGFNAFAKALQGVGLEALQASEAKNTALLLEIGSRMEDVCESCHKTFWYPPLAR